MGKIADADLADEGEKNFLWAKGHMTRSLEHRIEVREGEAARGD